jgi:hypothetical protein
MEGSENIVSGLEYALLKMYSAPSAKQIQTNNTNSLQKWWKKDDNLNDQDRNRVSECS